MSFSAALTSRDIARDGKNAGNAVNLDHRGRHLAPEKLPVLLPELHLQAAATSVLAHHLRHRLAVARIRPDPQLQRGLADHFFALIAHKVQERPRLQSIYCPSLQAVDIDGVQAGLEGGAIALFAPMQSRGSRFTGGDVPHHQKEAGNSVQFDQRSRDQSPETLAILLLS